MAGIHQGGHAAQALVALGDDGVLHQQDGVFGGNAHQHDQANQRRHGKAFVGQQQADKSATQRQGQGGQDGQRVQKAFEQQHQHDVDAQHPGEHGQAKAGEQLAHGFGVADLDHRNASRQVFHCGQVFHLLGHIAQGQAGEFNFKFDVARAVVAVDHRGARSHADLGHLGQHDRAALAGHAQAPQGVQILAGTVLQFDHDGDLALVQVEFRQTRVVVAGGGHAQGLANRRTGHAQIGGGGKVGHHHHLGAHQAGARSHIAQTGDQAQFALNGLGRAEQSFAVFAGQHQDVFFARAAQADFAAHPRQGGEGLADLLLDDLFFRALATLAHQQGEGGFARLAGTRGVKRVGTRCTATDGGVNAFHMRHLAQHLPRGFGAGLGLGQLGAGGQLQIHLGLAVVVGRDEAGRQQGHQGQGANEKRQRTQNRPPAVMQTPLGQTQVAAHPGRAGLGVHDGAQQVSGHHGGEGARHDQRGKHRQRCRPAKLLEKLSWYAGHEGGG